MTVADPALETLFLPLLDGALAWPARGGALFLGARAGTVLRAHAWPGLVCRQDFKPQADALQALGLPLAGDAAAGRFALVLLLPARQREQARAQIAHALDRLADGGTVLACVHNREGAKTAQADLARLVGPLQVQSKHHCRVFWSRPLHAGTIDAALAVQWRVLDAPRPILAGTAFGGRFQSRPGVFAWDRIDAGSALLAQHLPPDLAGHGADLGAGWGYLAAEVLARCPGVAALDLYEADARALELSRRNLAAAAPCAALSFHWHDVCAGLPRQYDFIVSNPPFHALGHEDRPDLGRAFLAAAATALRPGGRLYLVANRHLPYEAVLDAHFGSTRTLAQAQGFKVIEAVRG